MRYWLLALAMMGCTPVAVDTQDSEVVQAETPAEEPQAGVAAVMGEAQEGQPAAAQEAQEEAVNVGVQVVTAARGTATLPADVAQFIEARETCEHFLGEFVGDPAIDGPRGINQQIDEACVGLDEQLLALNEKHQHNKVVVAALAEFEPLY